MSVSRRRFFGLFGAGIATPVVARVLSEIKAVPEIKPVEDVVLSKSRVSYEWDGCSATAGVNTGNDWFTASSTVGPVYAGAGKVYVMKKV